MQYKSSLFKLPNLLMRKCCIHTIFDYFFVLFVTKTGKQFLHNENESYTTELHAQIRKYVEETGLLCILQLLVHGVNPSHCCTTNHVITSHNKFGNLKFGDPTLECQNAKINSLPIFLAI